MAGPFPDFGDVADRLAIMVDGKLLRYRRDDAGKWIAVDDWGSTKPLSDPVSGEELLEHLSDSIKRAY